MDIRIISVPVERSLEEFMFGTDAAFSAVEEGADKIILVTNEPDWLRLAMVGMTLGIGPDELLDRGGKDPMLVLAYAAVTAAFDFVDERDYAMPLN